MVLSNNGNQSLAGVKFRIRWTTQHTNWCQLGHGQPGLITTSGSSVTWMWGR
ncbi:MAG: hypothetical protein R3A10_18825 [Caldilineaceae bacterium]